MATLTIRLLKGEVRKMIRRDLHFSSGSGEPSN